MFTLKESTTTKKVFMKISISNKHVTAYIGKYDGDDEIYVAAIVAEVYDCDGYTIEFYNGHSAIDVFDTKAFADMYGMTIVSDDKNKKVFTRR